MSAPLIRVQALRWQFPQASEPLFEALSFDVPAGVSCLCGDEGRGKSTLLRLLAGQLSAQSGSISLGDSGAALSPARLQQLVAWHDAADPARDQQPVRAILEQRVPTEAQDQLAALLQGLSLQEHLDKPLYQLSTGSRRKVFIAATLARPCTLALLDQPGTALDAPSVRFLRETFARWAQSRERALLIADYQAPEGVPVARLIDLDRQGSGL
jgi:ATPase subunit of ABC transporter with duplicated ATPase domains